MRNIPFTKSIIVSGSERLEIAEDFENASKALADSAALNMTLLADWQKAHAQASEYARLLVIGSESMQALMQINLLISDALGKIRARAAEGEHADELGEFVEETLNALEAALAEFDSGEALA
jgi:hypothetical protein